MWHIQKRVSEVITKLQQLVIEDKVETCYIYAMIKILIQGLKEKLSGGISRSHPILYHPSHTIFFSHFFKVVSASVSERTKVNVYESHDTGEVSSFL